MKHRELKSRAERLADLVDLPPREMVGNGMTIASLRYDTIMRYSLDNSLDGPRCIKKVSLLHLVMLQDIKSTLLYGFAQRDLSTI